MYYITNQVNQIIAADNSLLKLLSLQNIDELYKKIALDKISFSSSNEKVTITNTETHTQDAYPIQTFRLQSVLGEMTLIQLSVEENIEEETTFDESLLFSSETDDALENIDDKNVSNILPVDTDTTEILIDDNTSFLKEDDFHNENNEDLEETSNLEILETDDDTISLLDIDTETTIDLLQPSETEEDTQADTTEISKDKESELFDLISLEKEEEEEKYISKPDTGPIVIDAEEISKEIGISTEDYDSFLNEYIDTALKLEEDLRSDQIEKYSSAITTLSHLSNVLHLPMITDIITHIKNTSDFDKNQHIDELYHTLTRLTTNKNISVVPMDDLPVFKEEDLPIDVSIPESFGTIDLTEVKPIHFDFRLEEAADDLSLPVELIEEFVHDFIEQAETETKNMLKAYENGDLDTIQKTGHMLKGASSNLRIKALSETLYKIQFCEKSEELEDLIKDYWGHFLAFKTQINLTSQ